MYKTDPLSFQTISKDIAPRKLPDAHLQAGENIIFRDGVITTRFGIAEFGLDPLDGYIMGISLFKKLRDTRRYLIAFTDKDAYMYNVQTGEMELRTRNYAKGNVSSSGTGNRVITLSDNYSITGTITNNSNRVSVSDATDLIAGMYITGDGIQEDTTILGIAGNILTISKPAIKILNPTGTLQVAGTTISNVSSTNGLAIGIEIKGPGIQPGTLISDISGSNVTISKPAYTDTAITGNTVNESPNISDVNNMTGIALGKAIAGTGIPANSVIIAINSNVLTISNNCTANGTGIALTITDTEATTLEAPAIGLTDVNITAGHAVWKHTRWNQANLYQISFDSSIQEVCNTWYTVANIDTNKQLTLAEDLPDAVTDSPYTLRLCYAGDADHVWHSAYPYSEEHNDKIMLTTNGVDAIQQFVGDGYFEDFINYPNHAKYVGYYGGVGYEHVIFANIYDVGSGKQFEQTVEWTNSGDLVFDGHYVELLDSNEAITGILPLANRLFIYKGNSISIAEINPNGGNISPWYITQDAVNFGTPAIRTVCNTGSYHILFSGNDIRLFDGHNHKIISEGNSQWLVENINREYQHRSFAFILPEHSLYCLYIPTGDSKYCDTCMVYNYLSGSWTYWKFRDHSGNVFNPLCKGKYSRTYAPRWEDFLVRPTANTTDGSNNITVSSTDGISIGMKVVGAGIQTETYINNIAGNVLALSKPATATATGIDTRIGWTAAQMEQRWIDLIIDERYTRLIFGDADGYLYTYAIDFTNDNNYPIASNFMTKDFALNRPEHDFRLLECIVSMQLKDEYTPATVDIRASVDFGRNWTAWQTIPLDGHGTYMEKKIYYNVVGKQVRFNVRMSNPMIFESMIIGFNAQYKSMKFDN